MLSIQYCPCNTINTILLVNTILIINCKQLESFKVRAKFLSHPLHIRFTSSFQSSFQSAPHPLSNSLQIRSKSFFQSAPNSLSNAKILIKVYKSNSIFLYLHR